VHYLKSAIISDLLNENSVNSVSDRLNCPDAVNMLQCQTRLLSIDSQKLAPSADKSKHDIPKSGSNTTRNVLIGVGVLAVGSAVYYVRFI